MKKIIIIGSGPAGLTAAIYNARANLQPLLIAGLTPGGQLTITSEVDNFPGFQDGVLGPDLIKNMEEQAKKFGTEFINGHVTGVDLSRRPFTISTDQGDFQTQSIIIATGASARFLGLDSETRFMGKGVSACATCDAFFYKNKEVMVVGGGDTALEEALYLTKFASKVTLVHRRDAFRGSKIMQKKVMENNKIDVAWDSVLEEIIGSNNEGVTGARLKNVKTGDFSTISCPGIFIAIGHSPNTEIFKGHLAMNDANYILTNNGTQTSVEGVFAAGDVQDFTYRQAITAAGSGCMAAIDAERFLENLE